MSQKTSIGRIVHVYAAVGGSHHGPAAAVVTYVAPDGAVGLEVFGVYVGGRHMTDVRHREDPARPADASYWERPPHVP